jgi:hypothetical protein
MKIFFIFAKIKNNYMNKALNLNHIASDLDIEKRVLYFTRRNIEARSKSSQLYRDAVKMKLKNYLSSKIGELENIKIEDIDRLKWFKKNNVFSIDILRKIKLNKLDESETQTAIQTIKKFSETLAAEIAN